jgi:Neurotransmitter-gated ion-channel ligand binding domain
MSWIDERLKWNPSDFNGLQDTSTEIGDLWLPDVNVYNS